MIFNSFKLIEKCKANYKQEKKCSLRIEDSFVNIGFKLMEKYKTNYKQDKNVPLG